MTFRLNRTQFPLFATVVVFVILYTAAGLRYPPFFSWYVVSNSLIGDNASLGLAAIGMTFVILSGGIDLSVGAMIALSSILLAKLVDVWGLPPVAAIPVVLFFGILFGTAMGGVIRFFNLPPFLVTLAGMFLARGLALALTVEKRISLMGYDFFDAAGMFRPPLAGTIFVTMLLLGIILAHFTPFGRAVYAIGGNEQSAVLMGIPVGRTKIGIYALSGFCSSLGGIVHVIATGAGDAAVANMLELDAIAAVVIGGTLLTGGIGSVFGTLIGVMILGVIQTVIIFEGTLSSWWTKIAIGILLLLFILMQRAAHFAQRD